MPEMLVVVLLTLLMMLAFLAGYWMANRALQWIVSEAQDLSRHWRDAAEKAEQTSTRLQEMTAAVKTMTETTALQARRLEALDFNVGQLTLRMVKEQVRVKGVQVGEEMTDEERLTGRRVTPPIIDRTSENASDGFFVDGKPVDPSRGVSRTIASAEPT